MRCVLSEIQITFAYVTINKYIKYIIRHTTSHHISAYNVRLASAVVGVTSLNVKRRRNSGGIIVQKSKYSIIVI